MRILAAVAFGIAALVLPGFAWGADQSIVNPFGCSLNGGNVVRPAGNEIVVRQGWSAKTRGLSQDFINSQTTLLSVNGGPAQDLSRTYTEPAQQADGSWLTRTITPTGIVLAPGESLTFDYSLTVSHRIVDGLSFENGEFGKPLFGDGTILDVTCTVTGV
jgi:hypothetical protein